MALPDRMLDSLRTHESLKVLKWNFIPYRDSYNRIDLVRGIVAIIQDNAILEHLEVNVSTLCLKKQFTFVQQHWCAGKRLAFGVQSVV